MLHSRHRALFDSMHVWRKCEGARLLDMMKLERGPDFPASFCSCSTSERWRMFSIGRLTEYAFPEVPVTPWPQRGGRLQCQFVLESVESVTLLGTCA